MLKQLRLQLELKKKRSELDGLKSKNLEYKKRSENLKKALSEATTEDDIKVVEESLSELEKEKDTDLDSKIDNLSNEISQIENELKEIDEKTKKAESQAESQTEKRSDKTMKDLTIHQVREMLKSGEYYKRNDVKEFYEKFRNIRAVIGGELTIPEVVAIRIHDIIGDYCTLYPIVDHVQLKGKLRILLDTDTTPAEWLEDNTSFAESDVGTIGYIDFDGYTLGKIVAVDNSILQDSIINLDNYIIKKIARSLGLALDGGILTGDGNKKPLGIITGMNSANKIEANASNLADILKTISLVDTGIDNVGKITVVMKRQTWYDKILNFYTNVDSFGNMVSKLPNLEKPTLCGLDVVFNQNMEADKILFGDFSKYTLVTREGINIARSEHAKFKENQTVFRGIGRFDGKPTNKNAFALVTLVA